MTENLASALAAFQASLPHVGKDNLAVVKSDKGSYKYTYADLADVSRIVLPALASHGLSFSAKPTLLDGKFVLEYTLRHTSGETDTGYYPLSGGTPQQVGSAVTYARRYCLSAITGVVADEDGDGQAAQQAATSAPRPAEHVDHASDPAAMARSRLATTCQENGWDLGRVATRYAAEHGGLLREATDAAAIERFRKLLFSVSDVELKAPSANGAMT